MERGGLEPDRSRSSGVARVLAPLALIVTLLVVVFVISTSIGSDDSSDEGGKTGRPAASKTKDEGKEDKGEAEYTVQSGDSLSTIAEETGVSVGALQRLNPDVDPQALIEGQVLKLR